MRQAIDAHNVGGLGSIARPEQGVNPFYEPAAYVNEPFARGWPRVQQSVQDALARPDLKSANDALKQAKQFMAQFCPELRKGNKKAQAFYREIVIQLSVVVTNKAFDPQKPENVRNILSQIAMTLQNTAHL